MSIREVPASWTLQNLRQAAPAFLFVYVTWCGYCKKAKPLIEQIAKAFGDALPVYAIDADKNGPLAESLGVKSFPTLFTIAQNGSANKFEGERSLDTLVGFACDNIRDSERVTGFCSTQKRR
jgi:thiol-disulfide isomerase/thioredoxin